MTLKDKFQINLDIDDIEPVNSFLRQYRVIKLLKLLDANKNLFTRRISMMVSCSEEKFFKEFDEEMKKLDKEREIIVNKGRGYDVMVTFPSLKGFANCFFRMEVAENKVAIVDIFAFFCSKEAEEIFGKKIEKWLKKYKVKDKVKPKYIRINVKIMVVERDFGEPKSLWFKQYVHCDEPEELNLKYPVIKEKYGDVKQFIEDYLNSNEIVLFLFGECGTGKSWFAHHVCRFAGKNELLVVRQEPVLKSLSFLEEVADGMIILLDDLDKFVKPRKETGIDVTGDLLSLTGGIVQIPSRIIITTNIEREIDPAFMRAGRTFAAIELRPHTQDEAKKLLEYWGCEDKIKFLKYKERWTLADLYGLKRGENVIKKYRMRNHLGFEIDEKLLDISTAGIK